MVETCSPFSSSMSGEFVPCGINPITIPLIHESCNMRNQKFQTISRENRQICCQPKIRNIITTPCKLNLLNLYDRVAQSRIWKRRKSGRCSDYTRWRNHLVFRARTLDLVDAGRNVEERALIGHAIDAMGADGWCATMSNF